MTSAALNGFLLIDKPPDMTSFYLVKILRKLANLKRIGYVGTLDPLATGLMIIALGEATKLIHSLEGQDKRYEVTLHLGSSSDTYDAKGQITLREGFAKPSLAQIQQGIQDHFVGEKEQMPPIFSAIQIQGKRAYDLARKGQKVSLKKRPVTFYATELVEYDWPLLKLSVHCSSGTYIRSLAHDLGELLQCGAYVETLRRVAINGFELKNSVTLAELERAPVSSFFRPISEIFPHSPSCHLNESEYQILAHGGFVEPINLSLPFTHHAQSALLTRPKGTFTHEVRFFTRPKGALTSEEPILAFFQGQLVGLLERVEKEGDVRVKFLKKFNLS